MSDEEVEHRHTTIELPIELVNHMRVLVADGMYAALKKWTNNVAICVAIAILLPLAIGWWAGEYDRDSTDPRNGSSGFTIRTDAMTGCQYLTVKGGGATPRLNATGRHICHK